MSAGAATTIDTPQGSARVRWSGEAPGRGVALLGHGAGGRDDTLDLILAAQVLTAHGWRVGLVDQPWRVAGRAVAPRPAALDAAWTAVVRAVLSAHPDGQGLLGGRSAGARVACRSATAWAAGRDEGMPAPDRLAGLLLISFPLHPPGKPQASRVGELTDALATGVPVRVVQGSTDPFGTGDEILTAVAGCHDAPGWAGDLAVRDVPGAHSFRAGARQALTQVLDAAVVELSDR